MRVLVSVRDLAEARLAAAAGVPFIDLKDPAAGALGGLPPERIGPIVAALRQLAPGAAISATVGDWPADALEAAVQRCHAVAATGVDHVKVGVLPGPAAPAWLARLGRLQQDGLPIVPVLIADAGVPTELLAPALAPGFAAVMLDTAAKTGGSLLERCPAADLRAFVRQVQAAGAWAGLAGALRRDQWPMLAALGPDFCGFRSAVCAGDRAGALDPQRLAALLSQHQPDRVAP